jgi:hypothetical protein
MYFYHYSSFDDFINVLFHNKLRAFGAICSLYFLYVLSMLAIRMVMFNGLALYVDRGSLIFLFPAFSRVKLAEIANIDVSRKLSFVENIAITKKDGKRTLIWATFLVEPTDYVVEEIRKISGL